MSNEAKPRAALFEILKGSPWFFKYEELAPSLNDHSPSPSPS